MNVYFIIIIFIIFNVNDEINSCIQKIAIIISLSF
jgi:hypothetical protein